MLPLHNPGTFANPLKQLNTASNFLGLGAKNPSAAHDFESILWCFKSLSQLQLVYQRCYECFSCFLCANQLASTLTSFRQGLIGLPGWPSFIFFWHYRQTKSKANPAIAMANPAMWNIDFGCCFWVAVLWAWQFFVQSPVTLTQLWSGTQWKVTISSGKCPISPKRCKLTRLKSSGSISGRISFEIALSVSLGGRKLIRSESATQ